MTTNKGLLGVDGPLALLVRGKGLAGAASLLTIGVVLWPVTQNWRKEPKDGFPLSYYPMFSVKRPEKAKVHYLVGFGVRGERQPIPYTYAGTGGLNQVRRQINKVVRGGRADTLCRIVAAKVGQDEEERFANVVTVQVVTGEYRLTDYFTGNREPGVGARPRLLPGPGAPSRPPARRGGPGMSPLRRTLDGFWFEKAPAARPAVLRVLVGVYVLYYLARRYTMFMSIARSDPALFKPVGVASVLDEPVPASTFRGMLVATLVANVAFIFGWRHRCTGPLFAGLLLWVMSYRNSWSMIYHNDNVLVQHAMILGLTPSADALSLDALQKATAAPDPDGDWRYGWPVKLLSMVTALTYFVAGVAKVKGPLGWRWADGEALRGQIAVDGLRKELLGGEAAPLAYVLYNNVFLFRLMGLGSLVLELGAPLALFAGRLSRLWAFGALQMYWGIYLPMKIKFRYQLSGLIFASFFDLDCLLTLPGPRTTRER